MKVNDIINKLWYVTEIVIIYRDQWEGIKEHPNIDNIIDKSLLYGTVNATRAEKFKEYKNNTVYSIGIIEGCLIITINK